MLQRDLKIIELLRRMAIDNPGVRDKFKIAAAVVYKRDIISFGINQMKTHPMQKQFAKNHLAVYLHAEINAISNALNHLSKEELSKSSLFIQRVKRRNEYSCEWVDGLAKPCIGCQQAILAFGIKKVCYSTDDDGKFSVDSY